MTVKLVIADLKVKWRHLRPKMERKIFDSYLRHVITLKKGYGWHNSIEEIVANSWGYYVDANGVLTYVPRLKDHRK
tara:strand:- start:334 stop:561 length:228 start_codon:yes stop_codon:yes gene_type:complete